MRPQSALRSPRLAHPLWSLDPRSAHATNVVRRMPTTAEAPSQQSDQVHERRALAHIARCARCDSTFPTSVSVITLFLGASRHVLAPRAHEAKPHPCQLSKLCWCSATGPW